MEFKKKEEKKEERKKKKEEGNLKNEQAVIKEPEKSVFLYRSYNLRKIGLYI